VLFPVGDGNEKRQHHRNSDTANYGDGQVCAENDGLESSGT
jgi:hypothetical protein